MAARRALTIGQIAKQLDWPIHRVDYLIRSRGMKPAMRVGNLRVFSDTILDRLRNEHAQGKQTRHIKGGKESTWPNRLMSWLWRLYQETIKALLDAILSQANKP
jgi:hypothetical protein